jgi:hypothetical protein
MGYKVNPPKRKYVKRPDEIEQKQALANYEIEDL